MAKNKTNSTPEKLFDKKADITTNDNGEYHIRKSRVYICGSNYYGKVYTITSNKYNKNNVHVLKEIYPYDNKRLRFLIVNFKNAKKFKTIEKLPNGDERKIAVIENFSDAAEYVLSIGNIKSFKSDLELSSTKSKTKTKSEIKKLILKNTNNNSNKKEKRRAA